MKHLIIAGVLVIIVTALLFVGLEFVQLLPEQAAAQAEPIDELFAIEFRIIAFLFALIVVLMLMPLLYSGGNVVIQPMRSISKGIRNLKSSGR